MSTENNVAYINRITASLKAYLPQVLDWFEDKDTSVFCAFMEQFPGVNAAQTATPEQLTQFFRSHQSGRTLGDRPSPSTNSGCWAFPDSR